MGRGSESRENGLHAGKAGIYGWCAEKQDLLPARTQAFGNNLRPRDHNRAREERRQGPREVHGRRTRPRPRLRPRPQDRQERREESGPAEDILLVAQR